MLLTARKLVRKAFLKPIQTGERDNLSHALLTLRAMGNPMQAIEKILMNIEMGEKSIILENKPDMPLFRRH